MRPYPAWLLLLMAYGAYMMVWISTPLAGLSFNAYDLSDWVVVYPATPDRPDSLMISMVLRLLPILLIWVGCFYFKSLRPSQRLFGGLLLFVLMISVAPPPELLNERNPDHLQRLKLFIIMLVGASIILMGVLNSVKKWVLVGLGILAFVGSIWSVLQVQTLLIDNSMPVSIGFSAFLFPVLMFLSIGWNLKWQSY